MNYFPNSDEEKNLIKFIAKYQYLYVSDAKYFFSSKMYYRNRIRSLIEKQFLKKVKLYLVLGELGIEYAKLCNFEYNCLNRNVKYLPRLLYISNLAAFYHNCSTVTFIASFSIKDKEMFTITARRFVGILEINGIEYLTYYISKQHSNKYIYSVIYDIQKEKKYKNIIILVDNTVKLQISDFIFGMNQVLIIQDTIENREKLKYMNNVNLAKIIQVQYRNKIFLAEYNFCEYTDYKTKYINTFYFLDTEKINRIKYFLQENKNKNMTIICDSQIQKELQKELPTCNYDVVELENYIEKSHIVYD